MSLILLCGWDYSNSYTREVDSFFTSGSLTTGRFGGQAVLLNSAVQSFLWNFTATSSIYIGFALKVTNPSTFTSTAIVQVMDGSTNHVDLRFTAGGNIRVTLNGTTIGTSSSTVASNTWVYIELYVLVADSPNGAVELKINGVSEYSNNATDTRNGGTAQVSRIQFQSVGSSSSTTIDDIYILNSSGSAPWNTFLGEGKIVTLYPNAAGDSTQFTPSAGSNFQCVDETTTSTTDYVESATVGHKDLYNLTTDTFSNNVFAVQVVAVARKTDAGTRQIQLIAKDASEQTSSTITLTSSDASYRFLKETASDSAQYEQADLDSLQIGMSVIA